MSPCHCCSLTPAGAATMPATLRSPMLMIVFSSSGGTAGQSSTRVTMSLARRTWLGLGLGLGWGWVGVGGWGWGWRLGLGLEVGVGVGVRVWGWG